MAVKKSGSRKAAAAKPKSSKSSPAIYTKPALRDRLKAEIMAGEKGGTRANGAPASRNCWRRLTRRREGATRRTRPIRPTRKNISTSGPKRNGPPPTGSPLIRHGETARYLPEAAWSELTPAQKKATDAKKRKSSREGSQIVPNTKAARKARKSAE